VIGEVKDRLCLIIDDIVDTAATLCLAAQAMKDQGAAHVTAYCTHPILSGEAISRIEASSLDEVVVTDTVPLQPTAQNCCKIRVLSLSALLAETLRRVNGAESVSSMFLD
jgi:ribose-phosphate pyrophosphokinase